MVDAYKAVFAKKEAIYGQDANVTPAANSVLSRNFSSTPLEVDQLDRKLDRAARGALPSQPSSPRMKTAFEVELAGSGAAGTPPAWMEYLQGCGMAAPVVTGGASAVQRFAAIGDALSSLTIGHNRGTEFRRCVGSRGDITAIDFTAGAYPFLGFAFTGLLHPSAPFVVNTAGAQDFSRFVQPLEVNTLNTSVSIDGYSAPLRSLRLQANAQITLRNLVGANYVQRGNHALKGKIVVEAPSLNAKNYFGSILAGSQVALAVQHGTVAGNIVQLAGGFLQIVGIADQEEDDVLMYELDVQLNISAGQDDLVFTAR